VAHWQLVYGSRRGGVSAIHLDPQASPALAERIAPSAIAGDAQHLISLLARARESGHALANLRTILAVGDPLGSEVRHRLQSLGRGAAVVGAWAPVGVRALWSECRQGAERPEPTGYHAWDDDVLELAPGWDGGVPELLWTGVGWRGSAVLRLRTHATVALEIAPCPGCGASGARVIPLAPIQRAAPTADPPTQLDTGPVEPEVPVAALGVEAVLDAEAEVAAWQVEYRTVDGVPETIVVLAPSWGAPVVPLIWRLDRHLRATQFVVLTLDDVAARVDASGGRRVVGTTPA
jgi:hypothetical protein